jgi:hypothetical protein
MVLVGSALFCGSVAAQGHNFGLGIIIGEPTGICGKQWLSNKTAVDGAVAWGFADEGALHLHGDFLVHSFDLMRSEKGSLPVYYGIGGRLRFEDDDSLVGVRVPVGLDYIFEGSRVDLFLELVPILDLAPGTELRVNAGLGVRYFF